MKGAKCKLHPLIHTLPQKNLAQSVVDSSKWQKCGLKYVMSAFGRVDCKKRSQSDSSAQYLIAEISGTKKKFNLLKFIIIFCH